ncbi:MAG TPA: hypothetical protein VFT98_06060 [Myxococcota bacterium]|nr:hypothetical protein [Myxococcota bacterium]
MAPRAESTKDGVTFARGAAPWRTRAWLAAAAALLLVAGWLASLPRGSGPPADASRQSGPSPSPPGPPSGPPDRESERRPASSRERAGGEGAPDAQAEPQQLASEDGEAPEGGVPSGIGLFPAPGTDPVKIGIVVPEDFPLPEGYLRHYQVTDDGQPMPAILLFHPDYELLDERGEPIPLPEDRVVPPELAPEGLPIELLVPPEPRVEEGAP